MNLTMTIDQQIAYNDIKKMKPEDAYSVLLKLVEFHYPNSDPNLDTLRALKTFRPAVNLAKKGSAWDMLLKTAAKKDVRFYLNGIFVKDDRTLVSSNGITMTIIDQPNHGLQVGCLYESNKTDKVVKEKDVNYPKFELILKSDFREIEYNPDTWEGIDLSDTNSGVAWRKYNDNYAYLMDYLKLIPDGAEVSIASDGKMRVCGVTKDGYDYIIIISPALIK